MGSSVSKTWNNVEDVPFTRPPSAPISTPEVRCLDGDPRSPTYGIARTPIEILKTPNTSSVETPCEQVILTDPRSPTVEFDRTPIVTKGNLRIKTLRNKTLDKVLRADLNGTPVKPKCDISQVTKKFSDKSYTDVELSSSSQSHDSISIVGIETPVNKRHSVVGLLETNLDYVETDLDAVIQNKSLSLLQEIAVGEEASELEFNLFSEEEKIKSESHTFQETVDETVVETLTELVEQVISKSPKNSSSQLQNTENEIYLDAANLQKTSPLKILKTEEKHTESKEISHNEVTEVTESPKHNSVHDADLAAFEDQALKRASMIVEELDRKLTNLIYEDKQMEVSSPKTKRTVANASGNRTPLGDRNVIHKKVLPVLKVSDKPTKNFNNMSKIPVFKDKQSKKFGKIQCENTPPNIKVKHSQWSNEDSLLI